MEDRIALARQSFLVSLLLLCLSLFRLVVLFLLSFKLGSLVGVSEQGHRTKLRTPEASPSVWESWSFFILQASLSKVPKKSGLSDVQLILCFRSLQDKFCGKLAILSLAFSRLVRTIAMSSFVTSRRRLWLSQDRERGRRRARRLMQKEALVILHSYSTRFRAGNSLACLHGCSGAQLLWLFRAKHTQSSVHYCGSFSGFRAQGFRL